MPYKSWKCEKMVSMTCHPFILGNYLNWVFLLLREIDCVEFVDINEVGKLHRKDFFENSLYENEIACRYLIDFCAKGIFNKEIISIIQVFHTKSIYDITLRK